MAGADVVMSFIGFEVLVVVVEADVAAGKGFGGFFVVLDVIGLEALVAVVNVDVIVREEEVAAFLLRAARPDFDVAGFVGVEGRLLRAGKRKRGVEKREKQSYEEEREPWRGHSPGMGVTIHAEHLCDENSEIA